MGPLWSDGGDRGLYRTTDGGANWEKVLEVSSMTGISEVRIFGERVPVRASIRRMEFYSAHGDRSEILRYLGCQDPAKVKRVFLVHGEDGPRAALKEQVLKAGFREALLPERGETCVL